MSKTKTKGTLGENGVHSYISLWYSDERWQHEGNPFRRIASEGSNDRGDVDGPFTCIEVKNHSNPAISSFLHNAEWKASNARKPYWFLCYKAKGMGVMNAKNWHVLMTLEELLEGFQLQLNVDHSIEEIYEKVPDWCFEERVHAGELLAPAPGRSHPQYRWSATVRFSNFVSSIQMKQQDIWIEMMGGMESDVRNVPFIVHPRRGDGGEYMHPRKWYVYTKLAGICRILEDAGVLPQDVSEYT